MKKKIISKIFLLLIIIFLFINIFGEYNVLGNDIEGNFVFSTNHFNGFEYSSSFIPSKIDTMYLLANTNNAITPRKTILYYWPITNELKADWGKQNVIIEGKLEIIENDFVIENLEIINYVIQYDNKDKFGTLKLFQGTEADEKYEEFRILRQNYRDDLSEFNQKMNTYRIEFNNSLEKLRIGEITEDQLPTPPEPLEDLSIFSTNLLKGFIVSLPKGDYKIRLRLPNGEIQVGSEKKLKIFEEINEGIGFEIYSSDRWTDTSYSNSSKDVIFTISNQELFLKPFWQKKFVEKYYQKMNNPQETKSRKDRYTWIPTNKSVIGSVITDKEETIELRNYFVKQVFGSALGYEIIEHDSLNSENPTFRAYSLKLSNENKSLSFQLIDEEGNYLNESEREIRVIEKTHNSILILTGFFPLIVGVFLIFIRKRIAKKIF